jgi:hypothetical protein
MGVPYSESDNAFLASELANLGCSEGWIGVYKKDGKWVDVKTGNEITYSNWDPTQGDSNNKK